MFRHIGVSIDSSDYCSEVTIQSLEWARDSGARIHLWYAQPVPYDPLARVHHAHRASEALTRVEAAAHAMGVPSRAAALFASRPAHEILNTARISGCDLIVSAREPAELGVRGSITTDLLSHTPIPVLTFGQGCPPARIAALELLRTEYQRLAALVHKWLCLLGIPHVQGERTLGSHRPSMQAVVEYVRCAVHPLQRCKEVLLFGQLRQRIENVRPEIDELLLLAQREHELLDDLELKLAQPLDNESAVADLSSALEQYARLIWTARGREEGVILPAARRQLSAPDWWDRLHAEFVKACRESHSASTADRFSGLSDTLDEAVLNGPGFDANHNMDGE